MSVHRILGAFSSNFLGISLSFEELERYQYFEKVYETAGVIPDRPSSISEMDALFIGTTLEHEARHWHDFLLSPLSLGIFRMRAIGLLNAFTIWQHLVNDSSFEVLPIPITDWVVKPHKTRQDHVKFAEHWPEFKNKNFWWPQQMDLDLGYRFGGVEFRQGAVTDADIEAVLRLFNRNQGLVRGGRLGAVNDESKFSFTPRTVFELSALNVQLMSVWHTYGEREYALFFQNLVEESSSTVNRAFVFAMAIFSCANTHDAKILRENLEAGQHRLNPAPDETAFRLGIALVWCLMGDRTVDGEKGCPAFRLALLLGSWLNGENQVYVSGTDGEAYIRAWDKHFQTTPYKTTSPGVDQRMGRALGKLEKIKGADQIVDPIKNCMQGLLEARKHFMAILNVSPSFYASPAYYERNLPKWPGCPVHIDLRQTGHGVGPIDGAKSEHLLFESTFTADQGKDVAQEVFRSSFFADSVVSLQDARELRNFFVLHDLLLEPDNLEAADTEAMRRELRKTYGKELFRVV